MRRWQRLQGYFTMNARDPRWGPRQLGTQAASNGGTSRHRLDEIDRFLIEHGGVERSERAMERLIRRRAQG